MVSGFDLKLLGAAAIGFSVGLWFAYAGLKLSDRSASSSDELMPQENKEAWVLAVTMTFDSASSRQEFLEIWRDEVDHVRKNEHGTLGYELLQSDQNPLQVMIFERYKQRGRDYLDVHKNSEVFIAFREKMGRMQEAGKVKVDGHSYTESNIGFMERHEDQR